MERLGCGPAPCEPPIWEGRKATISKVPPPRLIGVQSDDATSIYYSKYLVHFSPEATHLNVLRTCPHTEPPHLCKCYLLHQRGVPGVPLSRFSRLVGQKCRSSTRPSASCPEVQKASTTSSTTLQDHIQKPTIYNQGTSNSLTSLSHIIMPSQTQPWKQNRAVVEYMAKCASAGVKAEPAEGRANFYPEGAMIFNGGQAAGEKGTGVIYDTKETK